MSFFIILNRVHSSIPHFVFAWFFFFLPFSVSPDAVLNISLWDFHWVLSVAFCLYTLWYVCSNTRLYVNFKHTRRTKTHTHTCTERCWSSTAIGFNQNLLFLSAISLCFYCFTLSAYLLTLSLPFLSCWTHTI